MAADCYIRRKCCIRRILPIISDLHTLEEVHAGYSEGLHRLGGLRVSFHVTDDICSLAKPPVNACFRYYMSTINLID